MKKLKYTRHIRFLVMAAAIVPLTACLNAVTEESVVSEVTAGDTVVVSTEGAPVITGNPVNFVKAGDSYEFTPSVSDPNGDNLTLSVKNKPGWAKFDSTNGRFWGTPLLGSEGEYRNIEIVASDGDNKTSFYFSITVNAIGSASVELSWTIPTEYEDGSALTDLAGFYIYYGEQDDYFPDVVHVDNPSVSTYVVGNLTPKTYYFVATSYNSQGIESRQSNVAMKIATK